MRDLLDHEFLVSFALFSLPEHPIGMLFHIVDVAPGMFVLLVREGDCKAGFDSVCVHSNGNFTIVVPFGKCVIHWKWPDDDKRHARRRSKVFGLATVI